MSASISNPDRPENWMPVPDFEGYYEVSDYGNLRSVDRTILRSDGQTRRFRGVPINPGVMPRGHLTVCLARSGYRWTTQVHRLAMKAFVGPRPEGMEVRHLDGNPANNRLDNLTYGTALENANDVRLHGTNFNSRKTHCHRGHPFDVANTYWRTDGGRRCRRCKVINEQARLGWMAQVVA